ncbi:MAG TPA: hypothetical protein H9761_00165 [Candidatus Eisenbergiella merdavium]|uniref:Uncharacterized protein n=1 Tax=Candidatus Eisenbergiella merdavium TaxID=2838551 RepID=A0A9D2NAZ2_9FIRM|nr:hypothetical protein [Candidatus Eisenbergiella merdavium]
MSDLTFHSEALYAFIPKNAAEKAKLYLSLTQNLMMKTRWQGEMSSAEMEVFMSIFEFNREEEILKLRRGEFMRGAVVGLAEAAAEGKVLAVLQVLRLWGDVPEYAKGRIEKETDLSLLEEWLRMAAKAESIDSFLIQSGLSEYRNGLADGRAQAVLDVFKMRWDVPEDVQNAVLSQSDLSLLADWLKKAVEAESPEDIFQEIVQWREQNSEAEMEKIERGMPQEWKREAKKKAEEMADERFHIPAACEPEC